MITNYKFEIFPNKEQSEKLRTWVNLCRQVYNSALLDKINFYKKHKKKLTKKHLQTIQSNDKRVFSFLKNVPSQPMQEVLARLEKSFENFFRGDCKFPKTKKHKEYNSITFTQFGIGKQFQTYKGKKILRTVRRSVSLGKGGKLLISGLGLIDIKRHRKLDGKVKQVIIKRQNNKWFAIFSVEKHVNHELIELPKNPVGIDVGLLHYAVLSDGTFYTNHKFLRQTEKKLKKAQRILSKKKKGSSNWLKQLRIVQKLHTKVANQRRDFLHKLSYNLTQNYDLICVENLNIRNMVKNRKLAKSIYDAGWGMFRNMLQYKCEKYGKIFHKVAPHYTSVVCSNCGEHVKKSLSVRTHICTKCGFTADRDHNAALNILNKALEELRFLLLRLHAKLVLRIHLG